MRRIWEGGEGAKQPLVRLSWPVNQAGLDYHIWTTLLQPTACSSFASVDKNLFLEEETKRAGMCIVLVLTNTSLHEINSQSMEDPGKLWVEQVWAL